MQNTILGIDDHLLPHLEQGINRARKIRIIVSFIMESGVKRIVPPLARAAARGVRIEILTGRYLGITEPSALYYLVDKLGSAVDLRFYSDQVRSFHPKAFILDYGDEAEVFVGSSNISLSALTSGVEWNYRLFRSDKPEDYHRFSQTFDQLFQQTSEKVTPEVLRSYAVSWSKPAVSRAAEAAETISIDSTVEPRGAQIEALYELKQARSEGVTRGLVVAATGFGKTYLAAFDSQEFQRVLFVAHREEILRQAEESFRDVRPEARTGFFMGQTRDNNADIYFATVQTLSRINNLTDFSSDYFDYVIIDEFHHAAANSYMQIIKHFQPQFLLGLTATPYRMDQRDIFTLCDNNVVYEIGLRDAINRDLLVPFQYYGVFDPTDYDQVSIRNGSYDVEELEKQLSTQHRADLVLDKFSLFSGQRTLGFCVSIKHAIYMAQYFTEHGVKAVAVHSGSDQGRYTMSRNEAITALSDGKVRIVFTVDIFNEGVDIPSVDTVLFLRPTESFVIFLQQLGRGLRKYEGKKRLVAIDFIGNYKRAHYKPALLAGQNPLHPRSNGSRRATELDYPDECSVQFDLKVLDVFTELARRDPLSVRFRDEYFRLKTTLGRRPSRVEFFGGSDLQFARVINQGWLRVLDELNELTADEKAWLGTPAEEFLLSIEKTSMVKAFKIPTIRSFLYQGTIRTKATLLQIGEEMKRFYWEHPQHQQELQDKTNARWREWGPDQFGARAKAQPIPALLNSASRYFGYDEVNRTFYLHELLHPYLSPILAEHVNDILEYRRLSLGRRFTND